MTTIANPCTAPPCKKFKKTVILGYNDVAAAGCRTLLSLTSVKIYESLDIPELSHISASCSQPNAEKLFEQNFHPFQVIHSKYNEFSLVIVNCVLPGNKCHYVADKIMSLCMSSRVERLVILTALRFDISNPELIYENSLNGSRVTRKPPIPQDVKICDPFLSTMIQMIQLEELPCSIFITLAHKAIEGKANPKDGSEQAIQKMHDVLRKWHKLIFDKDFSLSMVYRMPRDINRLMFG